MAGVTVTVLRDETQEIDGKPFSRFLVYELAVPLPIAEFGTPIFSVPRNFTINVITVKTTQQTRAESSYVLMDVTDSELIGVLQVRQGMAGLRPIAAADLRADLRGPCTVLLRHQDGEPLQSGSLVVQLTVTGPAEPESVQDAGGKAVITVAFQLDGAPSPVLVHRMGRPPFSIAVRDNDGRSHYADFTNLDADSLRLGFTEAVEGVCHVMFTG